MRQAWSAVVFSLGLFALVAQTLLFRSYLTSFEGSELGIGSFFGTWLLWVALGALLGRRAARIRGLGPRHFVFLTLLYLPAFLLQDHLVANARALSGVVAYEVFPLPEMVATSLWANAPISLLTGFLFTLACRCTRENAALPVARVYVLESLGSFLGGILVTLLLVAGRTPETIFLCAGLLLALAAAYYLFRDGLFWGWIAPAILALPLVLGVGDDWSESGRRTRWGRLLEPDTCAGAFTTAQGTYLHGEREGQFVVMAWGGVVETLPNEEGAAEVMALTLAQQPEARRVLVVGPGSLALCRQFAMLPQVESVTWLHPDPEYPRALDRHLPDHHRRASDKLEIPERDVRAHLEETTIRYDLVLLHLPDATTLVLNRYSTVEFLALLETVLAPGAVVAQRISGGENFLGSELVYLGASAVETLLSRFRHVVLKPGEETWLLASHGENLTTSPATLRERFAGIEGAAELYPPEGLFALYPPDRIVYQMDRYLAAGSELGEKVLLNSDDEPRALLFSLAAGFRQAGRTAVARDVTVLLSAGAKVCGAAILLYVLLRFLYLIRSPQPRSRVFDGGFLVFSTGLVGMSLGIVLMFLYQSRYGSLYLHAGLIFSLFMLGLFLGSLLVERFLAWWRKEPAFLLPLLLGLQLGALVLVASLPDRPPQSHFALLFVVSGFFTGVYFPIGAHRLSVAGVGAAAAGGRLELIDHLGGAVGAVFTGLFLLPFLGTATTLGLLGLLVAANLVPTAVPVRVGSGSAIPEPYSERVRVAGYFVFGAAACALLTSHLLTAAQAGREKALVKRAALELTGGAALREKALDLGGGTTLGYFEVPDEAEGTKGYVFSTSKLAGEVFGYAGPITMAVHVDAKGTLLDFRVIRSRETPAYLERLEPWRADLAGRSLFVPDAFEGVDAVTGATMSSRAILQILGRSGRRFAREVLSLEIDAPRAAGPSRGPDRDFLALGLLMAAAVGLRFAPGVWIRRTFLVATVLIAGLWLNLQFSTHQVFGLLALQLPPFQLTGGFFVLVGVPLLVLVFGNVYCGWVCPFGALQELIGDLRPRRVETDPRPGIWRHARIVKYGLLAVLALLFALTRDPTVLGADPLITFFGTASGWILGLAVASLALSLFYRRFWCRNLCPAGAFLALLNRVQLLRRMLPQTNVGRCDLGVRHPLELDCLTCDRCRHEED